MPATVTDENIVDYFEAHLNTNLKAIGAESAQIIDKCVTLCNRFNLSAEEFTNQWEAYSLANVAPTDSPVKGSNFSTYIICG